MQMQLCKLHASRFFKCTTKDLPRTTNVTLQVWKKAPIFDFSALPIIPGDMENRLLAGLSGVAPAEDCDVVCNVSMLVMVLSGDLKICWLVVVL